MRAELKLTLSEAPAERALEDLLLRHVLDAIELSETNPNQTQAEKNVCTKWRNRISLIEGVVA